MPWFRAASERGIPCDSVDDVPNCDFFFGSVITRGSLKVAISTSGESPALAQRLRQEIDEQLPADLGPWLAELGQLRREVLVSHPAGEPRRLLLHQLAQLPVCSSPECPARQLAFSSAPAEEEQWDEQNTVYGDFPDLSAPAEEGSDQKQAETVHLVGAGPGDPELLTVKALHLLQTADVILHDDLVPQTILDFASPSALILNVGKRCGTKNVTQERSTNS